MKNIENTEISERIMQIIKAEDISRNKFALRLGYKRGQAIYDILDGPSNPSYDFFQKFSNSEYSAKYNTDWLLTGKGPMLKTDIKPSVEILEANLSKEEIKKFTNYKPSALKDLVPYYGVDFTAGTAVATFDDQTIQPEYYMDIPDFRGCKAFRAYSDSMEPLIKSGSILFGTKLVDPMCIEYGQVYGIILNDGRRMLKYIRRHPKDPENMFLLSSENKMYDDIDVPKSSVKSLWLIHGHLSKRI